MREHCSQNGTTLSEEPLMLSLAKNTDLLVAVYLVNAVLRLVWNQ
ncbi:hypothetical protein FHR32_005242 [Streptosporangium album]|uniref:Uncharacterized protein n=1 Tax=Streptosporangium album TaxID=47479 RepID=A0A7W7RZ89_9ACTN|nr:hypothetical protein [Streptosporangium album]MBB4940865.1 hypothetical protein [Streptosporangium album]